MSDKKAVLTALERMEGVPYKPINQTLNAHGYCYTTDRDVMLAAINAIGEEYNVQRLFRQNFSGAEWEQSDEAQRAQDKEVFLAAVRKDGLVLKYASEALKDDEDVVAAATEEDSNAWSFASPRIKERARAAAGALASAEGWRARAAHTTAASTAAQTGGSGYKKKSKSRRRKSKKKKSKTRRRRRRSGTRKRRR